MTVPYYGAKCAICRGPAEHDGDICDRCEAVLEEEREELRDGDPQCIAGCGYPVERFGDLCGECACEDDGG
jgi:hypothetical protein